MRVTSAIFISEFPRNGVQGTWAASLPNRRPVDNPGDSKTFVSLYSGNANIGRIDARAYERRRAATSPVARFAVRVEIRIDCGTDGEAGQ